YLGQAVEVAMQMKGVPIKMTWSREEDFTHDFPRPMQLARGRGRVQQGKITAFDLDSCAASMSASWFGRVFRPSAGPDPVIVAGAASQPFAIPNYRITGYRAPEMVPISSWRAPGANANAFFHECLFDELAHAAGADPLQERLRLCSYDVSRNVLETLGAACNWQGTDLGEGRGRGLAYCFSHGAGTAMVLDVTDTPDGIKLDDLWIVTDLGKALDPINLEAQLSGAAIFGLGHAMNCELTYADYGTEQFNYDSHDGMRIHQCPRIHVTVLENDPRIRGAGETGTPPAAPALANAIFAATGQRFREMPFHNFVDFL
ncbi:MAG: molybdopterin-dependent oxidoreductase, partial [Mangrovicoccus sp.]|nr:molybdopterin-dependent oxidoreductase [Mangrovicoccus sp.]